jgi:hypothetical protein
VGPLTCGTPVNYLQCFDILIVFFLSAVAVAPFLFHPTMILKELVRLEEKVDDIEVPKQLKFF